MNHTNQKTQDLDIDNSVVLEYSKPVNGVDMKGVVYHQDQCFFKGVQTPIEMTMSEADRNSFVIEPDQTIYESHEGTLIRVFNINGKWYTSTNRRLDASTSKWASKHETFGQTFTKAIREIVSDDDEDEEIVDIDIPYREKMKTLNDRNTKFLSDVFDRNLSRDNKYLFILKPTQEERIVCQSEPRPTIYHVGTFDKNDNPIDEDVVIDGNTVERPRQRTFTTFDELKTGMSQLNIRHHQGFLILSPNKVYKILHDSYKKLFDLRDNNPNLRLRYLQLRRYSCDNKIKQEDFDTFTELYRFETPGTDIENEIYELCIDLHAKYMKLYVEKTDSDSTIIENEVLRDIVHPAFVNSRIITTPTRINDLLLQQKPSYLNKLLKRK